MLSGSKHDDEREKKKKVRSFYKLLLKACKEYGKLKEKPAKIYDPVNERFQDLSEIPGLIPEPVKMKIQNTFDGIDEAVGIADDFCSTVRGEFEPILKRVLSNNEIKDLLKEIGAEKLLPQTEIEQLAKNLAIEQAKQTTLVSSVMIKKIVIAAVAVIAISTPVGIISMEQEFAMYEPTHYLSTDDSPFYNNLEDKNLENFADSTFTPGWMADAGSLLIAGYFVDSVDMDDGNMDENGSVGGSWFFNSHTPDSITFSFDKSTLNYLPTHAGIVVTDVINPHTQNFTFAVFGPDGQLLGNVSRTLGTPEHTGQTDEDTFFGAKNLQGISKMTISSTHRHFETDHLQFGR